MVFQNDEGQASPYTRVSDCDERTSFQRRHQYIDLECDDPTIPTTMGCAVCPCSLTTPPPKTTTTSGRQKNKRVRFSRRVATTVVHGWSPISVQEHTNVWYEKWDYEYIKNKNLLVVAAFKSININTKKCHPEPNEIITIPGMGQETIRGLEKPLSKSGGRKRGKRILMHAIRGAQIIQRERGISDPAKLASISRQCSEVEVELARDKGERDALWVTNAVENGDDNTRPDESRANLIVPWKSRSLLRETYRRAGIPYKTTIRMPLIKANTYSKSFLAIVADQNHHLYKKVTPRGKESSCKKDILVQVSVFR